MHRDVAVCDGPERHLGAYHFVYEHEQLVDDLRAAGVFGEDAASCLMAVLSRLAPATQDRYGRFVPATPSSPNVLVVDGQLQRHHRLGRWRLVRPCRGLGAGLYIAEIIRPNLGYQGPLRASARHLSAAGRETSPITAPTSSWLVRVQTPARANRALSDLGVLALLPTGSYRRLRDGVGAAPKAPSATSWKPTSPAHPVQEGDRAGRKGPATAGARAHPGRTAPLWAPPGAGRRVSGLARGHGER